jgi:hypothetical protein
MPYNYTLRLIDTNLHLRLIAKIAKGVKCKIKKDGTLCYGLESLDAIEYEGLFKVFDDIFSPTRWKMLCPDHDTIHDKTMSDTYRTYMDKHKVKYVEYVLDGRTEFAVSIRAKSWSWKLNTLKIIDPKWQQAFAYLVRDIKHAVEKDGSLSFSGQAWLQAENIFHHLLNKIFRKGWQMITFPQETYQEYKDKITARKIKHVEYVEHGKVQFAVPRSCRPHSWKLPCDLPEVKL